MPMDFDLERRYVPTDVEVRRSNGTFVVEGHAATFDEPYEVADFLEQIDRHAFDGVLGDPDVMALWQHNEDIPLGRTGAGTLEVSTDKRGLLARITFPKSASREREAVERGDVRRMSFGFRVAPDGDSWDIQNGRDLRTITKVEKLFDVSPVTFAANPKTDLSIARRSREAWRRRGGPPPSSLPHAERVRLLDKLETALEPPKDYRAIVAEYRRLSNPPQDPPNPAPAPRERLPHELVYPRRQDRNWW